MAEWPSTLPPPQKRISLTPGDTRKIRDSVSGRKEIRRMGSGAPDQIRVLFRLTWAQWAIFKRLHEWDLNLGLNWFSASWLTTLGYSAHKARFLGYPREVARQQYFVDVVATLLVQTTADIIGEDTSWPCAATGGEPPPPTSGLVVVWGDNTYGQISQMPAGLEAKKVVCGWKWAGALKENGTLVFWGTNASVNFTGTYESVGGIVDIAAARQTVICLTESGSIVVVGKNEQGLYSCPSVTTGVSVHATGVNALVVKSDGSVEQWGNAGMPSPPAAATNASYISGQGTTCYQFLAINSGALYPWGQYDTYNVISGKPSVSDAVIGCIAHYWGVYFNDAGGYQYWGLYDHWGSSNHPAGIKPKKIRGCVKTCVAIHSDDTVYTWGLVSVDPPTGLKAISIAAYALNTADSCFYIAVQKD